MNIRPTPSTTSSRRPGKGRGERLLAQVVSVASCEACHRQLRGIPGLSEEEAAAGFHGGSPTRPSTASSATPSDAATARRRPRSPRTERSDVTSPDAARRRPDGRQLPELRSQDPHGEYLVHENYDYAGVLPPIPRIRRTSATARRAMTARPRLAHDQDQGRRQLEDEADCPRLRRLPRRHQLDDRHRPHAEGQGRRPDANQHQRHRPRPPRARFPTTRNARSATSRPATSPRPTSTWPTSR